MPHTINVGARSLFVTITAWVFIALGLLAAASTLVQHATTASLLPGLALAGGMQPLPLVTGF